MAQFGATCPDLSENIQVLLTRCQMDSDDEVRDRATYYSSILHQQDKSLYNNYIIDILPVSIPSLERSLKEYTQGATDVPFDMKSVPVAAIPTEDEKQIAQQKAEGMLISNGPIKPVQVTREENYAEKLNAIPGIHQLGPLFRSSAVVELTESETEYVVRCIKHCYAKHIVLQFDCLNTLSDQLLENVRVQIEPSEGYVILKEIPCEKLPFNETGTSYVILQFPDDMMTSLSTFGAVLKFIVKDCDPATGLPDTDEGIASPHFCINTFR